MSSLQTILHERLVDTIDGRTRALIDQRRGKTMKRRGWGGRRALLTADLFGLALAFAVTEFFFSHRASVDHVTIAAEYGLFTALLPVWIVVANLSGIHDRDEERADHSTADDAIGVVRLV